MKRGAVMAGILGLLLVSVVPASASRSVLRPGSPFRFEDSSAFNHVGQGVCTLNFLFVGSDGDRYMGTAGHCQPEQLGDPYASTVDDRSWPRGTGPVAMDVDGARIGEIAYAIQNAPETSFSDVEITGPGDRRLPVGDFALVRLDPGVEAAPDVLELSGPTGVYEEHTSAPLAVRMYGNGYGLGRAHAVGMTLPLAARTLIAVSGTPGDEHFYATGPVSVSDSGAPVLTTDGRAIGVLSGVWEGVRVAGDTEAGIVLVSRIGPLERAAERELDITLELQRSAGDDHFARSFTRAFPGP